MKNALESLNQFLEGVTPGKLADEVASHVEGLLADTWGSFEGWDEGGMDAHKLIGRTERMTWDPPVLSFDLERHGAVVLGSKYAEIQAWAVDLEGRRAGFDVEGRRLIEPIQARVDCTALAAELAPLMISGADDPRLEWSAEGRVRVPPSRVFPAAAKQTTAGRSRRLRKELGKHLEGWDLGHGGWWTRPDR